MADRRNFLLQPRQPKTARHSKSVFTVMRNYGMNQNFADVNPERDFQPFNDEKNSHLQTKIS